MHGVQHAKFKNWVRKFRAAEADGLSGFVDLVALGPAAPSVCTIEIDFPSGTMVKLPSSEWELVRQLVG